MNCSKVSVIIPIYKSEEFLEKAITSVLNQSYSNIELILVNDGSPDNSEQICLDFVKKDQRVIYIKQENSGAAHAMRSGLKRSNGDYVMFLDGDDWINIVTIEFALNKLEKTKSDLVFWNAIKEYHDKSIFVDAFLQNDEVFYGERLEWLKRRAFGLINSELKKITKFDQISSGWGKIYKRNLLSSDQYCLVDINNKGNFDTELVCRTFYKSNRIIYLNEYFNHYRMYNDNSLTKTHGAKLFTRLVPLFTNLNNFISYNNLGLEYSQAVNNRVSVSILNCLLSITSKRNTSDFKSKYVSVNSILNNEIYKKSINKFEFRNVSLFHRLFFIACKCRLSFFVLLAGYLIKFFKNELYN
jgi:glycosyltransferase involved in cell wall biosynthesis